MVREASQFDMCAYAITAAGKYNAQYACGLNGVFAKSFVKIAYAEQQQSTWILHLDGVVLLH
jgi:hypothetical protein